MLLPCVGLYNCIQVILSSKEKTYTYFSLIFAVYLGGVGVTQLFKDSSEEVSRLLKTLVLEIFLSSLDSEIRI